MEKAKLVERNIPMESLSIFPYSEIIPSIPGGKRDILQGVVGIRGVSGLWEDDASDIDLIVYHDRDWARAELNIHVLAQPCSQNVLGFTRRVAGHMSALSRLSTGSEFATSSVDSPSPHPRKGASISSRRF